MSLTNFITRPEVVALLEKIRPKGRHRTNLEMKTRVQPHTKRCQLVGIAFDYLLRFEIQRQAPHAVERYWVADDAPIKILSIPRRRLRAGDLRESEDFDDKQVVRQVDQILMNARVAQQTYRQNPDPTPLDVSNLAAHAIRVAQLDAFVRSSYLGPGFADAADADDVADLVQLLRIVPYAHLLPSEPILLNPAFGAASELVGGADADLIYGDTLVDIKVTVNGKLRSSHLDQLLGYFLLSRECRRADGGKLPEIRNVGIYYARQGHLWTMPVASWTTHADFALVEKRFFEQARAGAARGPSRGTESPGPTKNVGMLGTATSRCDVLDARPSPTPRQRSDRSTRLELALIAAERAAEDRASAAAERAERVMHWTHGCYATTGRRAEAGEFLVAELRCRDCLRVLRARKLKP